MSGLCTCSAANQCPLGRVGSTYRCSADELRDKLLKLIHLDRRIDNDDSKGGGRREHDVNDYAATYYRSGF